MSQPRKTQALSLLEGILDETAGEAEAARRQLDAELKRKDDETRQQAEAEEQRRRDEIARRLAEEEARRQAAEQRRTATLEALRIEDLKAKGLWKEPEPPPVAAAPELRPTVNTAAVVAAQRKSRTNAMVAAIAAAVVVALGAAGLWAASQREFVDTRTAFPATAPSTVAFGDNLVATLTFQAIPDPVVRPATPAATDSAGSSTRRSSGSRSSSRSSTQDAAAAETPRGPRIQLGGNLGERN